MSRKIREDLEDVQNVSLHFDGALLAEKGSYDKYNRIAVIVKSIDAKNEEKIVSIPKTQDGSGFGEANCVIEALQKFNIKTGIKSICFDTTASNTSMNVGACKYIEDFVEDAVLYCACRSWIFRMELTSQIITLKGCSLKIKSFHWFSFC